MKKRKSLAFLVALTTMVMCMCMSVFGAISGSKLSQKDYADAYAAFKAATRTYVKVGSSDMAKSGHPFAVNAVNTSGGNGYYQIVVDPTVFSKLSTEEQEEAVKELASFEIYQNSPSEDKQIIVDAVTGNTDNATVLMNILFSGTKPNWGTAFRIFEPWNGPLGTIIAFIVIALSAFLVLNMALDIAYMSIPFIQTNRQEQGKSGKPGWVSHAAFNALEKANTNNEDSSTWKILWAWMKDRFLMLILLGACILYFINGSVFTLVAYFLDLASGIIG